MHLIKEDRNKEGRTVAHQEVQTDYIRKEVRKKRGTQEGEGRKA